MRILVLYLASWGLNSALQALVGSDGGFDPIGDIVSGFSQGFEEKEDSTAMEKIGSGALRAAQNLGGDFLGNRSFGWMVGSVMDMIDEDWSKTFFNDSIYQSQGVNIPAIQSFAKAGKKLGEGNWAGAASEFITSFLTPFGGKQLDKTIRGLGDYMRGGNYQSDIFKEWSTGERGEERYPIEQNAENLYKSALFGSNSVQENEAYWKEKLLEEYAGSEKKNKEGAALDAFISKYKKENPNDAVVKLYNATKNKEVFPFEPVKQITFTSDKKQYTIEMTQAEKNQYQQQQNEAMQTEYEKVIDSDTYRTANTAEKKSLLKDARSKAKSAVKKKVVDEYKKKNRIKK